MIHLASGAGRVKPRKGHLKFSRRGQNGEKHIYRVRVERNSRQRIDY